MSIKCYAELNLLPTFEERFEYLKLGGGVGTSTFGFDRYLNQKFYRSSQWKKIRDQIIIRDNGCDLGVEGYDIYNKILIHHMNPLRADDILNESEYLLNPEYLISVSNKTHDAIHYSNYDSIKPSYILERQPNDTCPWRKEK